MAADVCFLALGSSFFSFLSFFCAGVGEGPLSDLADLLDLAEDVLCLLGLSSDFFLNFSFLPVPFPDFSSSEEDEEEEEDLEDSEEVSSTIYLFPVG